MFKNDEMLLGQPLRQTDVRKRAASAKSVMRKLRDLIRDFSRSQLGLSVCKPSLLSLRRPVFFDAHRTGLAARIGIKTDPVV